MRNVTEIIKDLENKVTIKRNMNSDTSPFIPVKTCDLAALLDCIRFCNVLWVPTKERSPEESGEYIVVIAHSRGSTTLYYDKVKDVWYDDCNDDDTLYKVDFWARKPLPPQNEEYIPGRTPVKVEKRKNINYYICTLCGGELYRGQPYCDECGQALDWNNKINKTERDKENENN